MGRSFSRFLLAPSTMAKSKGIFIVHTLDPAFIAKVSLNSIRQIDDIDIVKHFDDQEDNYYLAYNIAEKEIPKWWRHCGIHESREPEDRIISQLSKLSFLRKPFPHFTVEQAREVIRIIFPNKAARSYSQTSYGLKHLLEHISELFMSEGSSKYCGNDTLIKAMLAEGFKGKQDQLGSPNLVFNITSKDYSLVTSIASARINKFTDAETF